MSNRKAPWNECKNRFEIEKKVMKGERPSLDNVFLERRALIKVCWDQDPAIRPSFLDIFENLKDSISQNEGKTTQPINRTKSSLRRLLPPPSDNTDLTPHIIALVDKV